MKVVNAINLVGKKFGKLTLLERKRENNRTFYYCSCDCGNYKWIRADRFYSKTRPTKSCGCDIKYFPSDDITGMKFGNLTAIKQTNKRYKNGCLVWECKCDCGNITYSSSSKLKNGRKSSCGCLEVKNRSIQGAKVGKWYVKKYVIEDTNLEVIARKIPSKRNTSGCIGVGYSKNRWVATMQFQKKRYYLGSFKRKEDAIKARKEAEENLHKNFLEKLNLDK